MFYGRWGISFSTSNKERGAKVIDKLSEAIRSQYPDKKDYSTCNLLYMCQFAKAYTLDVLAQLGEADKALTHPSVEQVVKLTKALNEITQEPLALIQNTENQSIGIMQQAVAQLGEVAQTLSFVYRADIQQIEQLFKRSAVVRTNWASHVILLNSKPPLGERYWYITQAVANGWSSNVLKTQMDTNLFARQIETKKVNNFAVRLPAPQSDLANYLMKDTPSKPRFTPPCIDSTSKKKTRCSVLKKTKSKSPFSPSMAYPSPTGANTSSSLSNAIEGRDSKKKQPPSTLKQSPNHI